MTPFGYYHRKSGRFAHAYEGSAGSEWLPLYTAAQPGECETCGGAGTVDERLGGAPRSSAATPCPDCGAAQPSIEPSELVRAARDALREMVAAAPLLEVYPDDYGDAINALRRALDAGDVAGDARDDGSATLQSVMRAA